MLDIHFDLHVFYYLRQGFASILRKEQNMSRLLSVWNGIPKNSKNVLRIGFIQETWEHQ